MKKAITLLAVSAVGIAMSDDFADNYLASRPALPKPQSSSKIPNSNKNQTNQTQILDPRSQPKPITNYKLPTQPQTQTIRKPTPPTPTPIQSRPKPQDTPKPRSQSQPQVKPPTSTQHNWQRPNPQPQHRPQPQPKPQHQPRSQSQPQQKPTSPPSTQQPNTQKPPAPSTQQPNTRKPPAPSTPQTNPQKPPVSKDQTHHKPASPNQQTPHKPPSSNNHHSQSNKPTPTPTGTGHKPPQNKPNQPNHTHQRPTGPKTPVPHKNTTSTQTPKRTPTKTGHLPPLPGRPLFPLRNKRQNEAQKRHTPPKGSTGRNQTTHRQPAHRHTRPGGNNTHTRPGGNSTHTRPHQPKVPHKNNSTQNHTHPRNKTLTKADLEKALKESMEREKKIAEMMKEEHKKFNKTLKHTEKTLKNLIKNKKGGHSNSDSYDDYDYSPAYYNNDDQNYGSYSDGADSQPDPKPSPPTPVETTPVLSPNTTTPNPMLKPEPYYEDEDDYVDEPVEETPDTYTIEELESMFKFIKGHPEALKQTFDKTWADWDADVAAKKTPKKEADPNADTYTLEELETFFNYMKFHLESAKLEFVAVWDLWDAWKTELEAANDAEDDNLAYLGSLLKDGKAMMKLPVPEKKGFLGKITPLKQ